MQAIKQFLNDEEGAVAIEYALLAALIALGIAVGANALGDCIGTFFTNIATALKGDPSAVTQGSAAC
jgi:pilus assembly protein Flp/PilA